jgi:hypothetical protein
MGWTLVNTRNGWQGGQEEEGPKQVYLCTNVQKYAWGGSSLIELFFCSISLFGWGRVNGLCQVAELGSLPSQYSTMLFLCGMI